MLRVAACCAAGACVTPTYTVPEPVDPTDPVREYTLEIPPNLEVRNVDFSATEFKHGDEVGGRGFLKVYAVDRGSGEAVLLIFEDIAHRKQPLQVIRFRSAGQTR
jgi:hypothetical protein